MRTMVETYDGFSRTSSFSYLGRDLVISYKATYFTRVFGILWSHGKKIEPRKISKEAKLFLIKMVCGDVPEVEWATLVETLKGRGLWKNIQEGHWHCLMDVVKSRLTGSNRVSDISFA